MKKASSVDLYIENQKTWREELTLLRSILLKSDLEEKMKWSIPVYCLDNKNVVGLGAFKDYFGLWFFYGAILSDPLNKLEAAQKDTKLMRHWKFSSKKELDESAIFIYINEAIKKVNQVPETGKKKQVQAPTLFLDALKNDPLLKAAFEKFTPYKKDEFIEYLIEAKQEKTKHSRLEKIKPLILSGIGLNDKYRS